MTKDKFSRARAAIEAVTTERHGAGAAAASAIRLMERALTSSLGGERMYGLPNLATGTLPYRGVRCLCKHTDERLPRPPEGGGDGREVLCINGHGKLVFARMLASLEVSERDLHDGEIRAEWPEDIAECILLAVDYHLEGCEKTTKRYTSMRSLSNRLIGALNGVEQ